MTSKEGITVTLAFLALIQAASSFRPLPAGGGASGTVVSLGAEYLSSGGTAIGTLVERTSRFTMLLHLPRMEGHSDEPRVKNGPALAGHGAEAVRDAIQSLLTYKASVWS